MAAETTPTDSAAVAADREERLLAWVTEKSASDALIGLEEGWEMIYDNGVKVLIAVLSGDASAGSKPFGNRGFSSLYSLSYKMCSQPAAKDWSEDLYQRFGEVITEYLRSHVVPRMRELHDMYLLDAFVHAWTQHKLMVEWLRRLFMHMDNAYIKNGSLPTLTSVGLKLFHTFVYEDAMKREVVQTLLTVINRERDGETIDRALVKTCVEVIELMGLTLTNNNLTKVAMALKQQPDLHLYTADFEDFLLTSTQEYYAVRSQLWLMEDSTPDYLIKAETALAEEQTRVGNYLNRSTESKLLHVVKVELLQQHKMALLEKEGSGVGFLLAEERREDLQRMYSLFSQIDSGLEPIATKFCEHVVEGGNTVLEARRAAIARNAEEKKKESASDPEFVQSLIALHSKYEAMVDSEFQSDALFRRALKDAFQTFCNQDAGRISNTEMISSYCDLVLKGTVKLNDAQIEEALDQLIKLFSYLHDKDLFAEIYRDQLAKRLLNKRSVSNEAEKSFIGKLKMMCGAPFTSKLEGMVNDFAVGDDQKREFVAFLEPKRQAGEVPPINFTVQVLTTGFWPSYKLLDVALPAHLQRCITTYTEWYDQKTSHRRLKWVHAIGEATVRGKFGRKSHDMVVTTLQALTLLIFNDAEGPLPFQQIVDALHLDVEVVKRLMHSLSCGKYKVLTKDPASRTISTSDTFAFSERFSSKLRTFRIPMASLDDTDKKQRVEEDRSFAIDACVVRIMKARKVLPHVQLVQEVLQQLHFFRPNPKSIKKRVEMLIEREYLERDAADTRRYRYLA